MSVLGGGSSGGGQTQTTTPQPYAPAAPALNQIISEAGKIYQQGPAAAGYVAPTAQTTAGLAEWKQWQRLHNSRWPIPFPVNI